MSAAPFPADPFGTCHCPPRTPGATDPRLVVDAVAFRPTRAGGVVHISAALWGGHYSRTVPLTIGQAHELAVALTEHVQAALAGSPRPWDDDLGRTPFASRGSGRGGAPAPARPRNPSARRRAPRDGYPRPRSIRPDGAVDSAP